MSTETTPSADPSARRGELLRAKLAARKLHVGADRSDRITRVPRPESGPVRFPLTATQRRMWFANRLDPNDVSTTLCRVLRLRGPLDVDRLARAARLLVGRHEVLRSTFHPGDGPADEPYQQVGEVPDEVLILAPEASADVADRAAVLARSFAGVPFDLAREQPLRLVLDRLADDDHLLLLAVHHVACDDASWQLLVGELGVGYLRPEELSGAGDRVQVGDVAVWQRGSAGGTGDRASQLYWRERLEDLPHPSVPAPDRVPAGGPETGWVSARLDGPVADAVAEHTRLGNATAFTVLLAAFLTVLHRRTGAEELAVGSPVSGRDRTELAGVVGDFGNTVVLRTSLAGDPTFAELLARTREVVLGALDHQELPFDSVVEHLALSGGEPGRPRADRLFRIMFLTYDDELTEGAPFGAEVDLEEIRVPPQAAQFDLVVALSRGKDRIHAESTYRGDRYDPATVRTLFDQMGRVLTAALDEPDTALRVLPLGPLEPGPAVPSARLPRLNPAPVAVTEPSGRTVPAAEVTARAHRLARELLARGAGPEQRVVVALRPSADLVAIQWALHLTGAVFVPVDPRHPAARTARVVAGVAPLVVVTERSVADRLDEALGSAPRLVVDDCGSLAGRSAAALGDRELREASRPKHAAYVIHTSGSTGAPKGVVVTRANLAAMLSATSAALPGRLLRGGVPLGPDDVWSVTHSAAFDFSVWEIWGAMAHGSRLVLVDPDDVRSPRALARVLVEQGVTVLSQTPSAFAGLVAADAEDPELLAGNALRLVVFGGESLEPELVRRWYRRHRADGPRLVNMYGITETTVHASVRPLDPSSVAWLPGGRSGTPIGEALPGQWLDVVDPNGRPVPTGVLGELWVGGPGVSRGYLGDRERTEQRFGRTEAGARYYRSGDLARRAPDGELLHLGRIDDQIGLRGFRIEPGEVAHAVAGAVAGMGGSRPGPADVAVLVREDRAGDPRLVAVVATEGLPESALARLRDVPALRAALGAGVIEAMVPSHVLAVDRLPLTASGKLDRDRLRDLPLADEQRPGSVRRRPPEGSAEEVVAAAFAEVLGVPEGAIGADDDFFALGGHSLLAVRLAGVLRTAFGGEVDVRTVFQSPTVAGLTRATFADAAGPSRPPLVAVARPARPGRQPIVELAHGLWFLHRVDPTSATYHVPVELHLNGRVDVPALRSAINDLVARHESLRTVYPRGSGGPEQVVLPEHRVELPEYTDLPLGELDRLLAEPFRLADAPPLRALLVWRGAAEPAAAGTGGAGGAAGDDARVDAGAYPYLDPRPPRGAAPQQPNHEGPTVSGRSAAGYPQAEPATADREPAGNPRSSATLVLCLHHIAADEGSLAPLVSDLATAYTARVRGDEPSWAPLPVQPADWAHWHAELLGPDDPGSLRTRQRDYWVNALAGAPERLELPLDRPRPSVRDSHGERIPLEVPVPVRAALGALATRYGASTFMVLHAALAAVLTRFGAGPDITVGSPVGRRTEPELAGVVGYFVNTVVLRTDTSGDPTFAELLGRSREAALGAYANADLPFEQVVRAAAPTRVASATPLFQVMLSYAAGQLPAPSLPELDVTVAPRTTATAKFDLTLTLAEHTEPGPDGATAITGMLGYRTDVFDAATARRIARAWLRVLRQVTDDPDTRVGQLDILGAERDRVLHEWNSTAAPVPVDDLLDQIRSVARATPDAPAVVTADGRSTSYRELIDSAHRLGHLLRTRLTDSGEQLVGVLLPRSPELVTALLGALAADGAFVAIDVGLPAARIRELCAPLHAVVTDGAHRELLAGLASVPVIELDGPDLREALRGQLVDAPPRRAGTATLEGDRAAYVVYTSGSTGVPKGAVIVHRAIASRLAWQRAKLRLGAGDAVLHKAPLTFDISINELLLPLAAGARLVLAESGRHGDLAHLLDVIDTHRVTFVYLTASMLEVLLDTPGASRAAASLRHLWCGGEKMTAALLTRTREVLDVTLYHGYGPAEATIGVCSETHPVAEAGDITEITLGRPNPNTALYALDERLQPVPPGVAGELYIGGILLGRGYLADPRRTAERFVADPFGSGGRLYATGDLVRYRDDGRLEFLGRRDNQVKVRGARVELEEVEQVLLAHPRVRQAATVLLDPGPSARLAVAWVPDAAEHRSGGDTVEPDEVMRWLRDRLPTAAVPSVAQPIAELPLFPSGKVNRALLAEWLAATDASERVPSEPPRGEREELVASVWADVLGIGIDRIGARDGFFAIGGNSLLMVVVQQRLAELTGHEVALLDLMSHPTVAELARLLDRSDEPPAESGVRRARARAAQARSASRRRVARTSWTDETEENSA